MIRVVSAVLYILLASVMICALFAVSGAIIVIGALMTAQGFVEGCPAYILFGIVFLVCGMALTAHFADALFRGSKVKFP